MAQTTFSPTVEGTNIAGSALNAVANGAQSAAIPYDNSSLLNQRALIRVKLANVVWGSSPSISLMAFLSTSGAAESIGGGPEYVLTKNTDPNTSGSPPTETVFDAPLFPCVMNFAVVNNLGIVTSGSGNEFHVSPYNDAI